VTIDLNGKRRRYYHERLKVEAQQGNPLQAEVSPETRIRLLREIRELTNTWRDGKWLSYFGRVVHDANRVLGATLDENRLELIVHDLPLHSFLTLLEISSEWVWNVKYHVGIERLQSILADDLSCYRFRQLGHRSRPEFHIHHIDNEHLHRTIVDRTFELTTLTDFASAQQDYAEAWKHYSRGDLDDALVNAGKAVESACKIVIKRLDPARDVDKPLRPLVGMLTELEILPSRLTSAASAVRTLFEHSGSLRNDAGVAHGSLELNSPEASVALLGLRLAGSLVSFLCERYKQMSGTPEQTSSES
jgi:hypothetical protein